MQNYYSGKIMSKKRQFGELESFIIQKIRIMKKASVSDIHFFIKDSTAYTTVMTVKKIF